jgi:hypothetical protein
MEGEGNGVEGSAFQEHRKPTGGNYHECTC